jgi:hypothetical protein
MAKGMTMADIIEEVGRSLYESEDWQARLGAALDLPPRVLRDFKRGKAMGASPDNDLFDHLLTLAERRAKETARGRDALKAWLKANRTASIGAGRIPAKRKPPPAR